MKMKIILQEHSITIGIIITIFITASLNFIGLIPQESIVNYLLLADGCLAISIFYSSLKNESSISTIREEIKSQSTLSKKVTRREHYQLLDAAINTAKSHIWIMTIDSALSQNAISSIPERVTYYDDLERIARDKPEISIRRIFGLPIDKDARKDKIEWIKTELDKINHCPTYSIRIFDWRKFNSIPTPLSLQIVDNSFVGLVNMQHAANSIVGSGEDICISDPQIVQHLQLYYEAIWEKCDELKTGDSINLKVLC